ncbi:uncharacterized protein DS421_15g517220 [Arachis hypogaea]|nr:uncharacterized protein DS421_15g517220 [Arachis hypogaea]
MHNDIKTSVKNIKKYVQSIIKSQEEEQANSFPRDIIQDPIEESEEINQKSSYSSELDNFPSSHMEEEEDAKTKEEDAPTKEEDAQPPMPLVSNEEEIELEDRYQEEEVEIEETCKEVEEFKEEHKGVELARPLPKPSPSNITFK